MKNRVLSLLMALVMLLSLFPMTALATATDLPEALATEMPEASPTEASPAEENPAEETPEASPTETPPAAEPKQKKTLKSPLKTAAPHSHEGWTEWTTPTSLPTEAGNYYLATNVDLTATWTVSGSPTNLCLNGHVIKQTVQASVITVNNGATLNLYDCDTTTVHNGYIDSTGLWHLGTGDGTTQTI